MLLKKYPSFFAFLLLATFFVSCEKEAVTPNLEDVAPVELTSKEFLDNYVDQTVIFHYAVRNETNDHYSGWLIDDTGKLRKYSLSEIPEFTHMSLVFQDQMRWLMAASQEVDYEVDLDGLVDNYKKIKHLNLTNIGNELNANASEGVTASFYAYKLDETNQRGTDNSCGCSNSSGGCGNTNYDEKDLVRILLYEVGDEIKTNQDDAALAMMDFLSSIKEAN